MRDTSQLGESTAPGRSGLIVERKSKREALENKIKAVDKKVSQYSDSSSQRISLLGDEVKNLGEELSTYKVEREVLEERKHKELNLFESNSIADLHSEKETRKESHRQLMQFIEEKSQILRSGLLTERKAREESGDYGIHQVRQEILRLTDRVDQELAKVEQQEANMSRKLNDETMRLQALIQSEKGKREKMQNNMLQILEDLADKHQNAIKNEKKERESTENLLVKLLENALGSIERGF